jgi:hypothetical protein
MARPTSKARLESGLKLDLNNLARRGIVKRGAATGPVEIAWNSDCCGEVARAKITANITNQKLRNFLAPFQVTL